MLVNLKRRFLFRRRVKRQEPIPHL